MVTSDFARLAKVIQTARLAKGFTKRELAQRAGLTPSTITRIEQGRLHHAPQPENLVAIARVLDLQASDLFAVVDWLPKEQLPSFDSYLRAKYADLPDEALDQLHTEFIRVAKRHGYSSNGTTTH